MLERLKRFRRYIRTLRYKVLKSNFSIHGTVVLGTRVDISSDCRIKAYSYIGPECIIGPGVDIGHYVMLGPRIIILGADHRTDIPSLPMIHSGRPELRSTRIGDDVWIGAGSFICSGVSIGTGSVVGAMSVVTHDLPAYSIAVGNPARILRQRFTHEEQDIHRSMISESPKYRAHPARHK